ncbi:MAG: phosphate transport system permease protein PstA [Nitrospirales bacterium]|nr:MAG: phosphate transport system permease protein PstA [Nitrospirales bacterium]
MQAVSLKKFFDSGTLFVWMCGAGLALSLLMIGGLLALIFINGMGYFWPKDLVQFTLHDGSYVLGEVTGHEVIHDSVNADSPEGKGRIQLKVGNRDLYGLDFRWIDESHIQAQSTPTDVVFLERREWGNFYGRPHRVMQGDSVVASGHQEATTALFPLIDRANEIHEDIHYLERSVIGDINHEIEAQRLSLRALELEGRANQSEVATREQEVAVLQSRYEAEADKLRVLYTQLEEYSVVLEDVNGTTKELAVGQIIRMLQPNAMGVGEKVWAYLGNVWTVLSEEPREANTEGGIFPAIFGTVLMVLIMSIAVVPFGVLAAVYLKEYATQGALVRIVRIAVNNLAGVPSIVFGVFGLGFFVYAVGGSIDALFFPEALPNPTFGTGGMLWASLTLALMTVPVVIVATEEGLSAVPREYREGSLALGATKLESLLRVVIPCAMPGILTGLILAISRATGEVAPLMLTGVVKLAPSMPLDGTFPFLHLDRKFMHLGFHIYDVGFQSPNVEAAKPMVYVTTLILVGVVIILNLAAISIRNRMRRKYAGSTI